MNFQGKLNLCMVYRNWSHRATCHQSSSNRSLWCKIGGPWTRSMKRGSMDPVHGGGPWTRGPCFVLSRLEHGIELQPYQWTSDVSGKGGEMARLIYDLMGNVILVQRIYLCANGRQRHKLRATTPDIHNVLPSYIKEYFPAVIISDVAFPRR